MGFHDLSRDQPSAHQLLVEANGTPFAPCELTKPVVDVVAGRRTHDDLDAEHWIDALEATGGDAAIYFYLSGDHEWWIAYDGDADPEEYEDGGRLDGPYHTWTTYPSDPWEHSRQTRGILLQNLEEIYWEGYPEERCDIYRSCVTRLDEAPEFVQDEIGGEGRA